MIEFPNELPLGLISNNSQQNVNYSYSTKFASGMSRKRKQFDDTPVNTSFSFILTSEQCLIFKDWFDNELKGGADWFLIKRLSPRGIEKVKCRMTGMYTGFDPVGLSGRWSMSFNAELMIERSDDDLWQYPDILEGMCCLDIIVNKLWSKA